MKAIKEMSGPELVAEHNRLAAVLGKPEVKRFANKEAAVRRCEVLALEVKRAQAKEAKEAATGPKRVNGSTPKVAAEKGETLKQQMDRFNALVAEAKEKGIKAKVHTSTFETHAKGEVQIAKLAAKINEAGAAATA